MNPLLSKSIKEMGISYLCVWIMTLISGAFGIWVFRAFDPTGDLMSQATSLLIIKSVVFLVSLGIMIYGVISAFKFSKELKKNNIDGGVYFLTSMILMLGSLLLSCQSIPGISIGFSFLVALEYSNFFADGAWIGILCVIAMLAFMASVIVSYIGVAKVAAGRKDKYGAVEGFRAVKNWSLMMVITAIVFSPVLLSYVAANIYKFENILILNILAAIAYIVSVVFFLTTWLKASGSRLIPSYEISAPNYVSLDRGVSGVLKIAGKNLLWTWITIIVSIIVLANFYYTDSSFWKIVSIIPYIAGWIVVIFGIINANNLNQILSKAGIHTGKYMIASYIILAVINIFSLNTIFGGSFYLSSLLEWDEIFEILSEPDNIGSSLEETIIYTSIVSLFLFILFPILSLIVTLKLSKFFPSLRRASIGALILVVSSIVFAPLLLCMAIDTDMTDCFVYLVIGVICYLVGMYYFVLPWSKCNTIREIPNVNLVSTNTEQIPTGKFSIKGIAGIFKNDRKLYIVLIIAFASIALSIFAICKSMNRSSVVDTKESNINSENSELSSNNNLQIEGIDSIYEGGNVHPDGFDEMIEAELEESARKFVTAFYSNIMPTDSKNWDEAKMVNRYFTPDFAKIYRMVGQNTPDGEIGYFDYDLFTNSQDPDFDHVEIKSITISQNDAYQSVATVKVSLISKVYPTEIIEISMIQNNNKWMISDYNGELEGMKNFLEMMP